MALNEEEHRAAIDELATVFSDEQAACSRSPNRRPSLQEYGVRSDSGSHALRGNPVLDALRPSERRAGSARFAPSMSTQSVGTAFPRGAWEREEGNPRAPTISRQATGIRTCPDLPLVPPGNPALDAPTFSAAEVVILGRDPGPRRSSRGFWDEVLVLGGRAVDSCKSSRGFSAEDVDLRAESRARWSWA